MPKRGRPTIITEAAMFAVWRLVQTEMHTAGHTNVSKACRAVMKRANGLVKFVNKDLPAHEQLYDLINSAERLRKRYYEADQLRHDAVSFPVLHMRALLLEQDLPAMGERHRAMSKVYEQMRKDGHHPDGSTLLKSERAGLAFRGFYKPQKRGKTPQRPQHPPPEKTSRKPA